MRRKSGRARKKVPWTRKRKKEMRIGKLFFFFFNKRPPLERCSGMGDGDDDDDD